MPLISVRLLLKMMAERSYLESLNLKLKKKIKKMSATAVLWGRLGRGAGAAFLQASRW